MGSESPTRGSRTAPDPGALETRFDIGVAHRMLSGERRSGDASMVASFEGGTLIGVIDGLGHGEDAAHPAQLACSTLRAEPSADVVTLTQRCHAALRRTRGAVMTLVQLHLTSSTMTWVGVGNVDGRLFRRDSLSQPVPQPSEVVLLRGGVVGYRLPPLRPAMFTVEPGDTLMLITDGVRPTALEAPFPRSPSLQEQAESLLAGHALETDDALVLIARYRGRA